MDEITENDNTVMNQYYKKLLLNNVNYCKNTKHLKTQIIQTLARVDFSVFSGISKLIAKAISIVKQSV